MSEPDFSGTFDEVQRYGWQEVAGSLRERDPKYEEASTLFFQKAATLRKAGDEIGERVFRFLGAAAEALHHTDSAETRH